MEGQSRVLVVALAWGSDPESEANTSIVEALRSVLQGTAIGLAEVFSQPELICDSSFEGCNVTRVISLKEGPASTLLILRQAAAYAKEEGYTQLVVVAAEPHLARCRRDLSIATAEVGLLNTTIESVAGRCPEYGWFNGENDQPHTCFETIWKLREAVLTVLCTISPRLYAKLVGT